MTMPDFEITPSTFEAPKKPRRKPTRKIAKKAVKLAAPKRVPRKRAKPRVTTKTSTFFEGPPKLLLPDEAYKLIRGLMGMSKNQLALVFDIVQKLTK